MADNPRMVFFDFCGTLIRFQTADRFVGYCRERLRGKRMIRLHKITSAAERLRLFKLLGVICPGNNLHKRMVLSQLKGADGAEIERLGKSYFEDELKPAVIRPVLAAMKRHIAQGDEVWIVSGGYGVYIRHFASCYGLSGYIASDIAFGADGACLGRMTADCMGRRKLRLLRERLGEGWDKRAAAAYSDSPSDLPLLSRVPSGVVVSYKRRQPWAEKHDFKEIIWE